MVPLLLILPLRPHTYQFRTDVKSQEFKDGAALEENDNGAVRRGTDKLGAPYLSVCVCVHMSCVRIDSIDCGAINISTGQIRT